ncbi:MAG TPA: M48 family metalloprotease [Candidatus Polarisedimenticolaceae bacterium]|nr:M48 family metalloprotease [Candidatus Polarisedimenticolaceae bacterium]
MKLALLAACCTLSVFAMANVATSLLLAWHLRARGQRWLLRSAAGVLFARCLPAVSSAALALLIALPSFLAHEPRDRVEPVSLPLAVVAAFGLAILGGSVLRGASAVARTRTAVREWMREATPAVVPGWAGRAWIVAAEAPGVCVVGLREARLLVSRSTIAACTAPELAGIVAHERAHARAGDNRKKLVLRCLPDVVSWTPLSRAVERIWDARAEEEADVAALRADRTAGVEIAAALVKLARRGTFAALPVASTLDAGGPLGRRVRRLLAGTEERRSRGSHWALLGAAIVVPAVVCALFPPASASVHQAIEAMVGQLLRF